MDRSLGVRSEVAEVRGETLLCILPFGLAMLQHAPHVGAPSLQLRRIFALLLSMTRTTSTEPYSPLRGSTFGKGPLSSPLFLVLVMCARICTNFSHVTFPFGNQAIFGIAGIRTADPDELKSCLQFFAIRGSPIWGNHTLCAIFLVS